MPAWPKGPLWDMYSINDMLYTSIVSCNLCRMIVTEAPRETPAQTWTFLTNHGHVLVALATDQKLRIRDVAVRVGITERAAQRILADLVAEGYIDRSKQGRRNTYVLMLDRSLRHPNESQRTVRDLIEALCAPR